MCLWQFNLRREQFVQYKYIESVFGVIKNITDDTDSTYSLKYPRKYERYKKSDICFGLMEPTEKRRTNSFANSVCTVVELLIILK